MISKTELTTIMGIITKSTNSIEKLYIGALYLQARNNSIAGKPYLSNRLIRELKEQNHPIQKVRKECEKRSKIHRENGIGNISVYSKFGIADLVITAFDGANKLEYNSPLYPMIEEENVITWLRMILLPFIQKNEPQEVIIEFLYNIIRPHDDFAKWKNSMIKHINYLSKLFPYMEEQKVPKQEVFKINPGYEESNKYPINPVIDNNTNPVDNTQENEIQSDNPDDNVEIFKSKKKKKSETGD